MGFMLLLPCMCAVNLIFMFMKKRQFMFYFVIRKSVFLGASFQVVALVSVLSRKVHMPSIAWDIVYTYTANVITFNT